MQNPAAAFLQANALSIDISDFEEAARYALLQRLAPALQHQLMGRFQAIDMISSMMELRLRPAEPDLARLRLDCASLVSISRSAVNAITHVMSWVEPKPADTLAFDAGVRECLGLLSMECRFKGFVIVNEIAGIHAELSSRALRSVLSATLLALSDLSRGPAKLLVRARAMPDGIALSIDLRPTEGRASRVRMTDYRPLKWRDVEILALAECVGLTRCNAGAQLTFPLPGTAVPTGPPGGPLIGTSR
ncbi:MAG: hypothetical protein ABIV07_09955 [Polaromonas sp.]